VHRHFILMRPFELDALARSERGGVSTGSPLSRLRAQRFGEAAAGNATLAVVLVWILAEFGGIARAIVDEQPGAWIVIATALVILAAAFVSSIAGFAFSALAGCALAYLGVGPLHAVQTMVVCSIVMQLYGVWKIRESIPWESLWPMLVAGAATIPGGVWLLVHSGGSNYAIGFGGFLIAYGGYVAARRQTRVFQGGVWRDVAAGALGGITGGFAGFPGPFVTIWCSLRGWDSVRQRAVYQPYILTMQIVTVLCLQWQAPMRVDIVQTLQFVPFALLGAIGGLAVFQRMTTRQFHVAVSLLLVVSGMGLIGRAV
jgi:uncharacterized membrane protein YfcA